MKIRMKIGIGIISLFALGAAFCLTDLVAQTAMEVGIHPITAWLILPLVIVIIGGLVWFLTWCFE